MSEYLTAAQLAGELNVSVRTVKAWVRQEKVPSLTLPQASGRGRRFKRLFRLPEVSEWLEAQGGKRYNVPSMGLYRRTKGKNGSDVWLYSFKADGQRVYGSTGETDKQKAFEVFTRKHQEYTDGRWRQGRGIALGKMVEKYLEWSKGNHTPSTYDRTLSRRGSS